MKIGIISDTHEDKMKALSHIIRKEFLTRGVELIIHCGDIIPEHVNAELFGNLPVFCALTDEQEADFKEGKFPIFKPGSEPPDWKFTWPNRRIVKIEKYNEYVGHKQSYDYLFLHKKGEIYNKMELFRKDYSIRHMFSGHTHHQIYIQSPLVSFINPGAVEDAFGHAGGYEFAILDTDTGEIIFSRIQHPVPKKKFLKLAVISDSLDISEMDEGFWRKLADKFRQMKVTHIIHCGNIFPDDVGHVALSDFRVHYYLREDQDIKPAKSDNWFLIPRDDLFVEINGYTFYVDLFLSRKLLDKSEADMYAISTAVLMKKPETNFILTGFTRNAFYNEGQRMIVLNPGDIRGDQDYAVIELPKYEITFGHIQPEPLPPLA